MRRMLVLLLCLAVLAPAAGAAQPPDTALFSRARALLQDGHAEQAWRLLSPLEPQHAGDVEFDYLLGIAALESARPNRATFILERVVAMHPGHMAARLEMARAYFALGDYERSAREFNLIQESAASPESRALARSYLARMPGRSQGSAVEQRLSGYLELTVGRDTNVSAASAQGGVLLPGLGAEFLADPLSRRRPDDFSAIGANVEYSHPLGSGLALVGSADLRQRWNSEMDEFDTGVADLQLALLQPLDHRDRLQYSVRHHDFHLDNHRYRETQTLTAQWARSLTARERVGLSAEVYRIRYHRDDARPGGSNLLAIGATATHLLHERTRTWVVVGLHLGHDNAVAGRADGDRQLHGFSVSGQRRLVTGVEGFARYSLLRSQYAQQNPDFDITRRDRQHDAAIGLSWQMTKAWSLRPQVLHTRNRSNLPLNAYSRTETAVSVMRVF